MRNIPSLQKLIRQLQHIPYLASKNIYRVAAHILSSDQDKIEQLCSVMLEAKAKINRCEICFNWTESRKLCDICASGQRDGQIVCVVETWHDLLAIEKSEDYNGVYHILGGSLCPLEGIGPDDLTVVPLVARIND